MKSVRSKFKSQLQDSEPSPFPTQPIEQTTINRNYKHLLCIPIPSTPNILHLHLAHNQISSLLNIHLYPHLQSLNISHNNLTQLQQFKAIANKEKLLRLSIRCNQFSDYGYQDKVVLMFKNLTDLDHIKLKNRNSIQSHKEYIKDNYVRTFYIIQRLKVMLKSFANQTRVNQTINKAREDITHQNPSRSHQQLHMKGLLKLLYENINQKSMYELTDIVIKNQSLQNLDLIRNMEFIVKIIKIIDISDVKCTCRPFNLRRALLENYGYIFDSMIQIFSGLYNDQLEKYLGGKVQCNTTADPKYKRMETLKEFSKLESQNVKIMDTLDYRKYFQKPNTPSEIFKVDRPDQLTTKPEQYYLNKGQQQKQSLEEDNSPDQFLFRFPVFAYSPDYVLVMATLLKKEVEEIINLHHTIVLYETNKTRSQVKRVHQNRVIHKHSKSRSQSIDGEKRSISTKARTTLHNNQNINYINEISFEKTLPQSTKQDEAKSSLPKLQTHRKSSKNQPHFPLLVEPVTAQKLYQFSLKYRTLSALMLNLKECGATSNF